MQKLLDKIRKIFGSSQKGFTLIELLIVIAILGVLAAGLFVAINPAQRLRDANTSTAKSTVAEYSSQIEQYSVNSGGGVYPADLLGTNPVNTAVSAIPTNPSSITYVYDASPASCTGTASTGTCTSFVFYATLQDGTRFIYDSTKGKTCSGNSSATSCN